MRSSWLVAVAFVACSSGKLHPGALDAPEPPGRPERHYTIWLGGARVGTAIERERRTRDAVSLRRIETMRFLRGDATISLATTIEIDATPALVPTRVAWTSRVGREERHAEATRDRRGRWRVTWETPAPDTGDRLLDDDGRWRTPRAPPPPSTLPSDAVPAELVPLIARRDGTFSGRVFLPARNFLGGTGRIDVVAPGRWVARLSLDGGAVAEATIDIGDDGAATRVVDGEGVIALRTTAALAEVRFAPVDLIAATAIPIQGTPGHTLLVDGSAAIPPVPGQLARREPDGIALELSPQLPGDLPLAPRGRDRAGEIAALVRQVRARIAPDLARTTSPRDAGSATAGDCTTFALAYAALAARRDIPTRVVTGLRIDGNRLIRHRWAVSWTGHQWIAVDAAYGAVPAGGDLIGLAVHGADDAGLVAGEAALAQIRSATWH